MEYLNVEQKYHCEKCNLDGGIYYGRHEDLMSVIYRIEDDHNKRSPECVFDVDRVIAVDKIIHGKME